MKKILSIVGARPQFVKLGPLSKEIRLNHKEIIVHTGQHYDYNMSQTFFDELNIPAPDYFLEVGSGTHGSQTAQMLIKIEDVLLLEKPDLVIVFGDTNSTLAGSLSAAKLLIETVHIEAGLRSFNKSMPEEVNRIVADHLSDHLFVPTDSGMRNLSHEGLSNKAILTGDIMVDSVKFASKIAEQKSVILETLGIKPGTFNLLTLHRPYNVDNITSILKIFDNLGRLSEQVVFPIHPRTANIVRENGLKFPTNFSTIEPLSYFDFLQLQMAAKKIITDSGGIQKEACILRKPCITLRTETEWTETVDVGVNLLINTTSDSYHEIIEEFEPNFDPHLNIFGTNCAHKMSLQINKILNKE